jgi:aldehyde dehydrogenase (NAD+)/betaine-aldehyde dehydrogenase
MADRLQEQAEDYVKLDVLDHGSPLGFARGSTNMGIQRLRYAARAAHFLHGEVIPSEAKPNALYYLRREPVGVCALVIPGTSLWAGSA